MPDDRFVVRTEPMWSRCIADLVLVTQLTGGVGLHWNLPTQGIRLEIISARELAAAILEAADRAEGATSRVVEGALELRARMDGMETFEEMQRRTSVPGDDSQR